MFSVSRCGMVTKSKILSSKHYNCFARAYASSTTVDAIPSRVFQIGFNKCATRSMAQWFERNQKTAVHWIDASAEAQKDLKQFKEYIETDHVIGRKMHKNYLKNQPLLSGCDNYFFFADFGVFAQDSQDFDLALLKSTDKKCWYELLNEQYPNSLYILNVRRVDKWLKSRFVHYTDDYFPIEAVRNGVGVDNNLDLVEGWKELWYSYICGTLKYFEDNQIADRLLYYDIDNDEIEKFAKFFEKHNIHLNIDSAMAAKAVGESPKNERTEEWDALIKEHPNLLRPLPEYERIMCEYRLAGAKSQT